ncbi:hypothetical protein Tco_0459576 [Tanacetum coccineum]
MPKALVPRILTGEKSMRDNGRFRDRVKISSAITAEKNPMGHAILNRKTKSVKFNTFDNNVSWPAYLNLTALKKHSDSVVPTRRADLSEADPTSPKRWHEPVEMSPAYNEVVGPAV